MRSEVFVNERGAILEALIPLIANLKHEKFSMANEDNLYFSDSKLGEMSKSLEKLRVDEKKLIELQNYF